MQKFYILIMALSLGILVNAQNFETGSEKISPSTSISFEQTEFNFGIVSQGEKVKNVFVFTNTGSEPLVIADAKGSCGCTVPEWPREPIMPGKSAYLVAVFDSANKLGAQAKRITITANTLPVQSFLVLKGEVILSKTDAQKNTFKNIFVDENLFTLYPIPASSSITLKFNNIDKQNVELDVFDHTGKLVTNVDKMLTEMNAEIELNVSDFTSGIYTVSVVYGDKMRLAKQFVVQ